MAAASDDADALIPPVHFFPEYRMDGDPTSLKGLEWLALVLTDLDGVEVRRMVPGVPWTLKRLDEVLVSQHLRADGLNAYLGTTWIGTTEY